METHEDQTSRPSTLRAVFTDFSSPWFGRWHGFLNLLIFLSCVTLALETVEPFATKYASLFQWMERTALLFFSLDYLGNLCYAKNRLRYFFSFWGLVDLISILPSFLMLLNLTALKGAKVLRILRVVRVLRVLKIARTTIQQMSAHAGNPIVSNLRIYFIALFSGLMISSTLMYFVEGGYYTPQALAHGQAAQAALDAKHQANPRPNRSPEVDAKFVPTDPISGNEIPKDKQFFTSIPASMWWSIVTLTTTGYGDMYPVTAAGRVIAGATMLLGLVLFGLLMNIIGETLMTVLFGDHNKSGHEKPTAASVLKSMFDVGLMSGADYDHLRAMPEHEVRKVFGNLHQRLASQPSPAPSTTHAPPAPQKPQPQDSAPAKRTSKSDPIRLPNASVGKAYAADLIAAFGAGFQNHTIVSVNFTPNCNLHLAAATNRLEGIPDTPGEFELEVCLRHSISGTEAISVTHPATLTINPEPSSLWKNLKSDISDPYWKPDTATDAILTPEASVFAASQRGRSHANDGKFRDDDFAIRHLETTHWWILICADGAGSAKFSRKGSQIASNTAMDFLANKLSGPNDLTDSFSNGPLAVGQSTPQQLEALRTQSYNLLANAAYEAHKAIHAEAVNSGASTRDFHTTFIALLLRRCGDQWFSSSFSVGDGGAGVLLRDGTALPLTVPDSGEYAGQTMFLTMPQIFKDQKSLLARTAARFFGDFRLLAAMTDGITDPIFESDSNLASQSVWTDFHKQLSEHVNLDAPQSGSEKQILAWLSFPSPGNHDDRTLLVMTQPPPSPQKPSPESPNAAAPIEKKKGPLARILSRLTAFFSAEA